MEQRPELNRRQTVLLISSLMLGMALAALDSTIVGTAMPTIVSTLGGVALYSWVVSAYLLTSTTTVPLYGRLADLYGRKPVFLFGIVVFLIGSALCGWAGSMEQLILFRAIQGLGAGAVQPMAMTIIGDAFGVEKRAKMQGFFAAVWGMSSVVGPALGGVIVTYLTWGWIFYVNVPVGLAALVMLWLNYNEKVERRQSTIDWTGAALLTVGLAVLLISLQDFGQGGNAVPYLLISFALLGLFTYSQTRTPQPIVPLELFRRPVIGVSYLATFVAGGAQFGVSSYVPLFVQGAMGGTALSVGAVLAPMTIGWPLGSIFASRIIMRIGYKWLLISGMLATVVGTLGLLLLRTDSTPGEVMVIVAVIGVGFGLTSSPLIIAIQNAVAWNQRGIATSLNQFARTIGGSCGVAVMGALFNLELARGLARPDAESVVSQVLDPAGRAGFGPEVLLQVQAVLATVLREIYLVPVLCALVGLALVVWKFPAGSVQQLGNAPRAAGAIGE
jgi:EmrB/QacA subfamily drug resistance transporter